MYLGSVMGFPDGTNGGKNKQTNTVDAGDIRDAGSIPQLGRSPTRGVATCTIILAWRIPWAEEPGGLQSIGVTKSWT